MKFLSAGDKDDSRIIYDDEEEWLFYGLVVGAATAIVVYSFRAIKWIFEIIFKRKNVSKK
jgi:hypothetical protein